MEYYDGGGPFYDYMKTRPARPLQPVRKKKLVPKMPHVEEA
jgi:hypothetical protein